MWFQLCYNLRLGKSHSVWKEKPLSQYYPQQTSSFYPPEQGPEDDYYDVDYEYENGDDEYEESGDTLVQRMLWFCAGGFLVFLCLSFCGLVGAGVWILDPGSSLVATDMPGSDIGLTFDEPAFPDELVVNDQNSRLTILEVNRNAALASAPPVEGQELIVVTIELVNLGEEAEIDFNERDFLLWNQFGDEFRPLPGVVDGALGRGSLPPGSGLEGRLVYQVFEGEIDLVLVWDSAPDSEPRYIYLE